MKDHIKGLMADRERTAKLMRRAQNILGSREALAAQLGVEPHRVGEWVAKISDAPQEAVSTAVDIIVAGGSDGASPG